jgi:hypothetical protein
VSKFQGDYTVGDMLRLNYSLFRQKHTDEECQPMIEALQYAVRMSHVMGKNIQGWRVLSAFGTGEGVKISTNIATINKALATYKHVDDDNKLITDLDRNVRLITQASSSNRARVIQITKSIESCSNDLRNYINKASSLSSSIRQYKLDLAEAESREDQSPLIAAMRDVADVGFFNYQSFDTGTSTVTFVFTTDDVIINKGLPDELFLGNYQLIIESTPSKLVLRVYQNEGNINVGGYYHPYISSNGEICWGDAVGIATKYILDTNIAGLMGLLRMILTTYSTDTTPWQGLDKFHSAKLMLPFIRLYNQYYGATDIERLPVKLAVNVGDYIAGEIVFARRRSDNGELYIARQPYSSTSYALLSQVIIPKDLDEALEWYDPHLVEEGDDNESDN